MRGVASQLPGRDYLLSCFIYDPSSGSLIWRNRPAHHFKNGQIFLAWNTKYAGKTAGYINKEGYWKTVLDCQIYVSSRIIWKMMTGDEPAEVDHRNRKRSENCWDNLRASTKNQNQHNASVKKNNLSGLKGVRLVKKSGHFAARIGVNGKLLVLGTFHDKWEAHAAYCDAARQHFGEFWSDGSLEEAA
jgi:HNH endonuclease